MYHSHLIKTNDGEHKELDFDQFGQIIPVEGTHTPQIFINFDYQQKIIKYEYYTFEESIFQVIIIIPVSMVIIFSFFGCFNIVKFYSELAALI